MTDPVLGVRIANLVELREQTTNCVKCDLARGRTQTVFGSGNVNRPPVAFVGEAPTEAEDSAGVPFVGPAGALLRELVTWMGYTPELVYFTNVVLCRPPEGRAPSWPELVACREHLHHQLRIVEPHTIVALGHIAAQVLTGTSSSAPMGFDAVRLLGWVSHPIAPVRVTYHPAYVIRNPATRQDVYSDLAAVRQLADLSISG